MRERLRGRERGVRAVAEGDLLRHGQRGLGREEGGRNANEPRQDAAHRGLRTEGRR